MQNNRPLKIILVFTIAVLIAIFPVAIKPAYAWQYTDTTNLTKVLLNDPSIPNSQWVHNLYNFSRGFVNIIAFLILLIIAFANILHINIETYSVKKLLPTLIFALIAANLAMPIIALFSKIIDTMTSISWFRPINFWEQVGYILGGLWDSIYNAFTSTTGQGWGAGVGALSIGTLAGIIGVSGLWGGASFIGLIYVPLFLLVSVTILFLLSLIFAFRPFTIFLAAAFSPVAIMFSVLPQTQRWFKRWLGIIIPWMIMPIATFFILRVAHQITQAGNTITSGSGPITVILGFLLPSLIKVGAAFLALRFPFLIEKDLSSVINKVGTYAGKGAWIGIGQLADYAYKSRNERHIRKSDKGEKIFEAAKTDVAKRNDVKAFRRTQIENIIESATKKIKNGETLTAEERKYSNMSDSEIDQELNQYVTGADIVSRDQIQDRQKEVIQELNKKVAEAQKVQPSQRTEEQRALAALNTPAKIKKEAAKIVGEEFRAKREEVLGVRASEFGASYANEWQRRDLGQRLRWKIMRVNPYGLVGTLRDRYETGEKERQKTYGKYSIIGETARGRFLDTKYYQQIAKDDLGELPTAEQMIDYCRSSMAKFYANVRRHLESQGIEGLTDEQVYAEGNRMLRRFRTDVKGTKDYIAHPYFDGLTGRDTAIVLEGDYYISRQMAIEMRRRDRVVEDAEIERKKLAIYAGGSGAEGQRAQPAGEPDQSQIISDRNRDNLLRDIIREQRANPTMSPAAIARAVSASSQLGGLNANEFSQKNLEVVLPNIALRAKELGLTVNVDAAIQGVQALDVGQIETSMNASGISDEKMRSLLGEYMQNHIASIAVAGRTGESTRTIDVARKISASSDSPGELQDSIDTLLTEQEPPQ